MIKKQAVRELIIKNRQRLLCNQILIKLEGKDEVPFELDKMFFVYNGISTTDILRGIGLK
jgi:DNA polymerase-1